MTVGFEVVAVLQVGLGAMLVMRRASAPVLAGGLTLMLASIAIWALSRTVGLEFIPGEHAEPIGFRDSVCVPLRARRRGGPLGAAHRRQAPGGAAGLPGLAGAPARSARARAWASRRWPPAATTTPGLTRPRSFTRVVRAAERCTPGPRTRVRATATAPARTRAGTLVRARATRATTPPGPATGTRSTRRRPARRATTPMPPSPPRRTPRTPSHRTRRTPMPDTPHRRAARTRRATRRRLAARRSTRRGTTRRRHRRRRRPSPRRPSRTPSPSSSTR